MNKDSSIVKKIHPILRYETEACAEYLEKMAAKGLFIKSINNYVFCFEKTEPRKVKFYIDAFERAGSIHELRKRLWIIRSTARGQVGTMSVQKENFKCFIRKIWRLFQLRLI